MLRDEAGWTWPNVSAHAQRDWSARQLEYLDYGVVFAAFMASEPTP